MTDSGSDQTCQKLISDLDRLINYRSPNVSKKKAHRKPPSEQRERHVVDIDLNRLDDEWMTHSALYQDYGAQLADAQYKMDTAKTEVDTIKAELDAAIRADPDVFGLEKITEPSVANCIKLQSEYQVAESALHDATRQVRLLQATVRALDHRKSALENLVRLYLANYFGDPTMKRGTDSGDMDRRLQDRADKIAERNRRRKRKTS